jgi:Domain of unknown function (DUF5668)/B-box zinc finger
MNCANHADASAVAYCRTCGKALCANCTRPVRGVIYCEDCLGAKMEGSAAGTTGFVSSTFTPATPGQVPPPPPPGSGSGPNPTVAGILGAIPFGIGAVYNGQYAKGLAHLGIFALLVAGCNSGGDVLPAISGIGIAFFVVYQIIDAVRSARAIQAGLPAPDPYGLGATFGGGAKIETSKIPMGAVVLILLGVLFLLHTMGFAEYGMDRFWPLILIALGAWLFVRNWGLLGSPMCSGCQCARCRSRRVMGPAMLLTIGFLFLLQALNGPSFWHGTWPVVLLVIGGVKLLQGSASAADHIPSAIPPNAGGPIPPTPPVPPVPPVPPTNEVNRG